MTDNGASQTRYKRNYLTEVLARIDFVSPLKGVSEELPKPISAAALKRFPIAEPRKAFTQQVLVSVAEVQARREEFMEWNFHGRDREKRVQIAPQSILVSYSRYESYEDLSADFSAILEPVFQSLTEAQPSRLGLRYINQVELGEGSPMDWTPYINRALLGLFAFSVPSAKPCRVFHNFEVVHSSGFNVRFQFGVHNPDYPAAIRRKVFVLDYDAFFKGSLELNQVPDYLSMFHASIQDLFERSITDGLRGMMNG